MMRILGGMLLCVVVAGCGGSSGGGGSNGTPGTGSVPAAPVGVSATPKDGYVLLDAAASSDSSITGYNVYWSTSSGVSITSSNHFQVGASPQAHTGLVNGTTYYYVLTALNTYGESGASSQVRATPALLSGTGDPLYTDQWNLKNSAQTGATGVAGIANEDINVEPAWTAGHKGSGQVIAIVDDGLEIAHEDLASNVGAIGTSYNYVTGSSDPTNDKTDTTAGHGTSCAGIAAARDFNNLGGRGVAPRATLVGYNMLKNSTTLNEADAMVKNASTVSVSSNSWGATDGTGKLYPSDLSWRNAIDTGLSTGRNGLGTIYTWAAGNGALASVNTNNGNQVYLVDNSNFDGQANYRGVIAVAAVNDQGKQSSYSESGANLWVSAPGGEFCSTHAITTTDRTGALGKNPYNAAYGYSDYSDRNYTKCMNGTSAATPTVAGVVALVLEAKPTLTWRDVRNILAQSARKNDVNDAGWYNTGGGFHFNHKYGYGVVNAGAAVTLAGTWTPLPAQNTSQTYTATPNQLIPDNNATGVTSTINVSGSNISSIEYIDVTFSATDHTYQGDLTVTLTSPFGTTTVLAESHPCISTSSTGVDTIGSCGTSYSAWRFGDAGHLGETVNGNWTLRVSDNVSGDTGTFQSWGLKFYGH